MNQKNIKKILTSIFLLVAGCIVLYWLLHEPERVTALAGTVKGIIAPFVLGAALAFIINVPMRAFEGKLTKIRKESLRRLVAVVLAMIAVLLVIGLVFVLLIPQLVETVEAMVPKLYQFFLNLEKEFDKFLAENPDIMEFVAENTELESLDWGSLVEKAVKTIGNSVTVILTGAFSALGSILGGIVDAVVALVFAFYCLFQKENLARQGRKLLYAFLKEPVADCVVRVMRLSNSTFSNFLSGQCVEVCILGGLFAISMAIFRMPYIPLVSVLVAVTAFIPVVGAWIGCALGAFFILVNDPMQAVWFVIMFVVLQQIENNMIYPRVVGTSIGLSGMWVLVAVSVGGALFGVAGMFLMIPFASVLYTLLQEITTKRLAGKEIDPEKLKNQPPELRSRFKEKRERKKANLPFKKNQKK